MLYLRHELIASINSTSNFPTLDSGLLPEPLLKPRLSPHNNHAHGRLQSLNAILRAAHLNGVHEVWSLLLSAPRGKMIITASQCISSRHDVLYHPHFAPHLFLTEAASVTRLACRRRRKQYDGQRNWGSLSAVESHQTRHSGSPTRDLSSCPCSIIPPANLDRLRTHHFPTPRIGPEWW